LNESEKIKKNMEKAENLSTSPKTAISFFSASQISTVMESGEKSRRLYEETPVSDSTTSSCQETSRSSRGELTS
jgi:hypothetical protein